MTPTQSLWLTLAPPLAAGEVQLEVVNQVGGAIAAVAVEGNLAYVGVGPRLVILDVSNPQTPVMIGQSDILPAVVLDVVVVEQHVYMTTGGAGLWVADVTWPDRPLSFTFVPLNSFAFGFQTDGQFLFVIGEQLDSTEPIRQISIMSLENPAVPVETATWLIDEETFDFAIAGNYLYLVSFENLPGTSTEGELVVIDISDPSDPVQVATSPDLKGSEIAIGADRAYIFVEGDLLVVDVSDPTNPIEITRQLKVIEFYPLEKVIDVKVEGDTLALIVAACDLECGSHGVIFNITQSGGIEPAGEYPINNTVPSEVVVHSGTGYVAAINQLFVTDTNNPGATSHFLAGEVYHLALVGDWVYGSEPYGTLTIFDQADPVRPSVISHFSSGFYIEDVAASEGYVYLGTYGSDVRVIEVINPLDPEEVAATRMTKFGENTTDVVAANGYIYMVADSEFIIVDATNPQNPFEVSRLGGFESPYHFSHIALENSFVYGVSIRGLTVLNVSDPTQPQEVSQIQLSYPICSVAVSAGYAYVVTRSQCYDTATTASTLQVINVADPTNPFVIAFLSLSNPISIRNINSVSIAVEGQYAYVAADGLWLIDISNPAAPRQVGFLETPGDAREVVVDGELVYVADGEGGLLVLRRR